MALCIFGALGLATSAMPGKTFLVTGATDGIGLETVKQLTRKGHGVIVHGRTGAKVDGVVKDLQRGGGVAKGYTADLASFAQIRAMADAVRRDFPVLDGLLNNAGTFDGDYSGKRVLTEDGNELSLQVNVLAPFLLTSLLLPCVRASGAGRVIIASSVSMGAADALDDLQLEKGWSAHRAYSLSKLCDAMLSYELHSRYGDPPRLTFNTMDPTEECGMGCDTKMLRAGWGGWGAPASRSTISATMLTADEWAARSGEGFSGRREVRDATARSRLWDACVKLTGAEYP
mmetsp:Transcript_36724/g.84160  ORF Transcript_36724/g.84160 Transcript_36724/m.84160 type:complete len:287 (+) Transcript_36724:11-871(+)